MQFFNRFDYNICNNETSSFRFICLNLCPTSLATSIFIYVEQRMLVHSIQSLRVNYLTYSKILTLHIEFSSASTFGRLYSKFFGVSMFFLVGSIRNVFNGYNNTDLNTSLVRCMLQNCVERQLYSIEMIPRFCTKTNCWMILS